MTEAAQQLEQVLDKLVHDVQAGVHAMYRGDVRQQTLKSKSDAYRREARDLLLPLVSGAAPPISGSMAASPGASLAGDEVASIMRCIMAWMSMGAPTQASPQSRCVPAAKELMPSWGEREKARLAMKRVSG